MPEFEIDDALREEIDRKISNILIDNALVKSELQSAGHAIFIQIKVESSTTVKQIFQMYDDVDKILSSHLPSRREEPRWAQSYFLGNRIIYGNIGGLEL